MIQNKLIHKFSKKLYFNNNKPNKLTNEQRLKKKSAYFKRRLTRLLKRSGWLKRKNFKRLKRLHKQRRYSMFLNKQKLSDILIRSKKMYKPIYFNYKCKFIWAVAQSPKNYNPNLTKYKISKYKAMFVQHTNKFNYFSK